MTALCILSFVVAIALLWLGFVNLFHTINTMLYVYHSKKNTTLDFTFTTLCLVFGFIALGVATALLVVILL